MSERAAFVPVAMRLVAAGGIWAAHFTVVYAATALACAGRVAMATLPWTLAIASTIALLALTAVIVPALRARGRAALSLERYVAAALGGLAVLAIAWEALAFALAPACGTP